MGEGQALGVPPTFGGPYVGLFACKQDYIRQMPGRIVGRTVDTRGEEAYVLTLQTSESSTSGGSAQRPTSAPRSRSSR